MEDLDRKRGSEYGITDLGKGINQDTGIYLAEEEGVARRKRKKDSCLLFPGAFSNLACLNDSAC